jgi:hypothetical protein
MMTLLSMFHRPAGLPRDGRTLIDQYQACCEGPSRGSYEVFIC